MSLQCPVKFIKKIPPSGGAPSYKLTLNHSVVEQQLSHCVDVNFELASSSTATQTWQGCISPRRNKDRNEYVLQGWKLFAEAHQVHAGDQVCFEMNVPWRLVVSIIQPAGGNMALISGSDQSGAGPDSPQPSPSKTMRLSEDSSPSRLAALSFLKDTAHEQLNTLLRNMSGRHSFLDVLSEAMSEPYMPTPRMAQGLQSWMSLSSLGRNELTDMSNGVPARSARRSSMFSRRSATPEASPDAAIQVVPSESVIDDHEPPAADSLAGFFDNDFPADFDDLAYLAPDMSLHQFLGVEEHEMESLDQSSGQTCYYPTPAATKQASEKNKEAPADGVRALSAGAERLCQSTKAALHATMKVETTVMDMTGNSEQVDRCALQAQMFKELSALKECLWQVLVISNDLRGP